MSFNNKKYQVGRARGLELGYTIYKKKGIDALRKDIDFRIKTGIDTDVFTETVDRVSDEIKGCTLESVICIVLVVLRDEFDFGGARARKVYDVWGGYKETLMKKDIISWLEEKEKMVDSLNLEQMKFGFKPKTNQSDYEKGRMDGLKMVLKYVQENDMAELKKIFNHRARSTPSQNSLKKQSEEVVTYFANLCYETAIVLAVKVLHEVCRFGEKRMQRVMDRLDLKTLCMEAGYVTWQEQVDYIIRGELGIDVETKWMVVRELLTA